jgi:hypothetical protein
MNKLTISCVSALTALSTMACSGAGPSDGTGPIGASNPGPATRSVTVSVHGFIHSYDGTRLPGVQVCPGPVETSGCTTSGSDGSFTLSGLPANATAGLYFHKAGFLSVLRTLDTQESDITLPERENALPASGSTEVALGVPAEAGRGHVAFFVASPGAQSAPGVSVTLGGGDGSSPAPLVLDAGLPGVGSIMAGAFANLNEGLYVVRFGGPSVHCTTDGLHGSPLTAFQDPTSGQTAILVPVVAGTVTAPIAATCVPR